MHFDRSPLVTKGVGKGIIQFLLTIVLYPDQRAICIGQGKVVGAKDIKQGLICVTNRSIIFYHLRGEKAYDYNLIDVIDFSYERGFFSSMVKMQLCSSNIENKEIDCIILQGVPKGKEEQIISLLRKTAEERKRFEDEQKSKGLFRYGLSQDIWGSREEGRLWLEQYLTRRGFKKLDDRWVTEQEYFDYQQRQKGLYRYIEAGIEKWSTIDEILDGLSPSQFEDFVGLLMRSMGYEVTNLPYVGDYGADLLAKRDKEIIVVQAKKYSLNNRVGAPEVQRTLGSIWKYNATRAMLVTTSRFTTESYEQAKGAPIELWDRDKLKEALEQHLPSNLIKEKPKLFVFEMERICNTIISQASSYADPQTVYRIKIEIKREKNSFNASVSGPPEYVPFLEKAINERIPAIPIELRKFCQIWLNNIYRNELEYIAKHYPDLII